MVTQPHKVHLVYIKDYPTPQNVHLVNIKDATQQDHGHPTPQNYRHPTPQGVHVVYVPTPQDYGHPTLQGVHLVNIKDASTHKIIDTQPHKVSI